MDNMQQNELELIKKYGFAPLPQRIEKREEEQENRKETNPEKFAVQCQRCGRMGMMSLEEMEQHSAAHEDRPLG